MEAPTVSVCPRPWSLLWLCIIATACLQVSADLFHDDGVLVDRRGEVRRLSAIWQLVVVIAPPTRPPVEGWAFRLRQAMAKVNDTRWYSELEHWEHRLVALIHKMGAPVGQRRASTRHRRAPFDFVGNGASWLFGVATREQLTEVATAVRHGTLRTDALAHNQDLMLTMLNRTRITQIQEAHRIYKVSVSAWKALEGVQDLRQDAQNRNHVVKIEIAMEELTAAVLAYLHDRAHFQHLQSQVDAGGLTGELLDRPHLRSALAAAKGAGHLTLAVSWYYRYARIYPVQGRGGRVTFSVALPVVAADRFIQYDIRYLPVRFGEGHLRYLTGAPTVAVNTRRRSSFLPNECLGQDPTVCRPAMEATTRTCEAALVSGEDPAGCTVRVVKPTKTSATVLAPTEGSHLTAIAPHVPVLTVSVMCPGKAKVELSLQAPTVVTLPPACQLEGEDWVLNSVVTRKMDHEFEVTVPALELPSLNISWPTVMHPEWQKQLEMMPELQVPLLNMNGLKQIPHGYVTQAHFSLGWIIMAGMAGVLAISGSIYCCAIRRRRKGRAYQMKESPTAAIRLLAVPPSPNVSADGPVPKKARPGLLERRTGQEPAAMRVRFDANEDSVTTEMTPGPDWPSFPLAPRRLPGMGRGLGRMIIP